MSAAEQEVEMDMPGRFSADELARRRAASRRLAWVLGVAALAIYLIGFIFYRP